MPSCCISVTVQYMSSATHVRLYSRALRAGPRRALRVLGGALLSAALVTVPTAGSVPVHAGPVASPTVHFAPRAVTATTTYDVINATNRMRRGHGLANLTRSAALSSAAQRHANEMAARRTMTHTGADGSNAGQRITREGFYWRIWGENVAAGQTSAEQVVQNWMASPGHRANILNWRFQYIGIGVARASNGVYYWCMVLVGR